VTADIARSAIVPDDDRHQHVAGGVCDCDHAPFRAGRLAVEFAKRHHALSERDSAGMRRGEIVDLLSDRIGKIFAVHRQMKVHV
jgi:hypothetical protein